MTKSRYLNTRLTDEQIKAVTSRAKTAGVTRSDYARALLLLPFQCSDEIGGGTDKTEATLMILSNTAFSKIEHLMRSFGNLYNQSTRSLNALAKAQREGDGLMYPETAASLLSEANAQMAEVARGLKTLQSDIDALRKHCYLYMQGSECKWQ